MGKWAKAATWVDPATIMWEVVECYAVRQGKVGRLPKVSILRSKGGCAPAVGCG